MRKGFKVGCRKVIGLDGTFLKDPHLGILLTVVANDTNNGMFLIVYAMVEAEKCNSWTVY